MYRTVLGLLCATALATTAAGAADLDNGGSARASFEVTGFVPVTCRANLDATVVPVTSGEVALGKLNEFCNSPAGYDVFVESSPELADAMLIVDGREVPLSATGSTLVASADGPAIVSREIRLTGAGSDGGSLNFRVMVR